MTTLLTVCAGCARHVRVTETRCPFCAAAVTVTGDAPSLELPRGVSRHALAALGVTLSLGALRTTPALANPPHVEAHPTVVAPYGAPPVPRPLPPTPSEHRLVWRIELPARIRLGARAATRLDLTATNVAHQPVRPEREHLRLLVNGAPSTVFDFAFGNGLRGPEWNELPPGRTARDARMIVADLLPAPGVYELVLQWDGQEVARRRVTVVR